MRISRAIAVLILALFPLTVCAEFKQFTQWGRFDGDFDNEKPWVEIEAQLPPYPKDENLLPFFVSAATDNQFFIDSASISVSGDGVVRYTLIVKSSAGAANVSFEGIRCASHERRLYAFGRKEGSWSKARSASWEPISYKDRNRQHHVLYDDFFCPNGIIVKDAPEAVDLLKRGFR